MNTQNIFYRLRIKSGLSQDELAEKAFATRQAVSRWGNRCFNFGITNYMS